ncbi:MAG: DNA repair protein RadC [Holdemanella sp.]|nr:DNA repair protein RadC [Holdemanella sp.]
MRVKELAENERPIQKALRFGFSSLNNVELIAIIVQTGVKNKPVFEIAREVLDKSCDLARLFEMDVKDLMEISGIREVKAIQLLAGVELSKRAMQANVYKQPIRNPEDIVEWFKLEYGNRKQEHFISVYLDSKLQIIKHSVIFIGTMNEALVDPKLIIKEAILCNAFSIICVHNHPTGNVKPSDDDFDVTERLEQACKAMGIILFDHIIVGKSDAYSFKMHGYLD